MSGGPGEWETITTWRAVPDPDGWRDSKPPESVVADEPDHPAASMRARIDSLLPDVRDAQVIRGGRSVETWIGGQQRTEPEIEAEQ